MTDKVHEGFSFHSEDNVSRGKPVEWIAEATPCYPEKGPGVPDRAECQLLC